MRSSVMSRLCSIGILLTILSVSVIIYHVVNSAYESNIVSEQETEYPIVDMTVGFAKLSSVERSIFTIALDDENRYTLPAIPTSYVRNYYIGDAIPVIVTSYTDGTQLIDINRKALNKGTLAQ